MASVCVPQLQRRGHSLRFYWQSLNDRGIHTFMDDEELRKGEEITPALFKAIQRSRIAIVVLSENYASSSFCLDELSHILDYIKGKGRFVWPVFYNVDPSDVRKLRGTFGEAMAIHEASSNNNTDRLQKWKNALQLVANLTGTHYKWKNGYVLIFSLFFFSVFHESFVKFLQFEL